MEKSLSLALVVVMLVASGNIFAGEGYQAGKADTTMRPTIAGLMDKIPLNITVDNSIVYGVTTHSDGSRTYHFHATITSNKGFPHIYAKFKYGSSYENEEVDAIYNVKAFQPRGMVLRLQIDFWIIFEGQYDRGSLHGMERDDQMG